MTFRRVLGALALIAAGGLAPGVRADRALPPPPAEYVLDEVDWLTPGEERALNRTLLDYERKTSNQFVVALFRSLEGEDQADWSQRVAEAWGIGQEGKDNGVLLVAFADERRLGLEIGYGLEGAITDLEATLIRTEILEPAFRNGERFTGVRDALAALAEAAGGEYRGTGRANSDRERGRRFPWGALVILLIVIAVSSARRRGGPMVLGPPSFGRRGRAFRRSPWIGGGFGGGLGGGFGGGRGGGFSGGGGAFGGGGSRGSW
jgi:uncharacterized protein